MEKVAPWKSRLGDYGAIQVSAGYGGREQLPLQQTDVCAQETATPRSHVETAHSGRRAPASLLERIQFERLQRCYDGSCWRRRWGLKTGVRTARVRPLIRSFRSSSVPIFSKKNKWIFEDTRTFIEAASWMLHLMVEWIIVCSSSTVTVLVPSC